MKVKLKKKGDIDFKLKRFKEIKTPSGVRNNEFNNGLNIIARVVKHQADKNEICLQVKDGRLMLVGKYGGEMDLNTCMKLFMLDGYI